MPRKRFMGIAGSVVCVLGSMVPFAGSAAAADTGTRIVTVRGTAFPAGRDAGLSYVGCSSMFSRTADTTTPQVGNLGDAALGNRALGFDLQGGNAVGSLHYVGSFAATTSVGISVAAPQGTTGVAYAAYQAPTQVGTSEMWIGRAALSVPAGGWTSIEAVGLTYSWVDTDTATGQPVVPLGSTTAAVPVTATPHQFSQAFGPDGSGVFTVGFGCDGNPFAIDALGLGNADGTTVYDLEGRTSKVQLIGPASHTIEAGESVSLQAVLRDGSGGRISRGTVVLSAKAEGGDWRTVTVLDAADTDPSYTVTPNKDTVYRFEFVDRPLYEGSVSKEYAVHVRSQDEPDPSTTPTSTPTEQPTPEPDPTTSPAGPEPTESASESAPATPTETATSKPDAQPSQEPAETASAEPSKESESSQPPASEQASKPAEDPAGESTAADPAGAQ
ncbi:hypothetical protein [Nocardioides sp.]|uniref:hypothetical protein n=1 Tax=Nocardioides sp. TaxID=35761 RepID=UPI0039E61FD8